MKTKIQLSLYSSLIQWNSLGFGVGGGDVVLHDSLAGMVCFLFGLFAPLCLSNSNIDLTADSDAFS